MLNCRPHAIASMIGMLSFLVLRSDAAGQSAPNNGTVLNQHRAPSALLLAPAFRIQPRSLIAERIGTAQATPPAPSRDTLRNGAIIGAVAGAATLGAVGAIICKVEQEPGVGNCLSDTVRVAAIGAAIGAGAGLAVDAALTRQGGIAVRVGIRF